MNQQRQQQMKQQEKAANTNVFYPLIMMLLFLFLFFKSVKSQPIFRVNHAAPATSTQDGSSWANAYRSLQDAIENATPGTEIWVAQGTYKPSAYPIGTTDGSSTRDYAFTLKTAVHVHGGFDGTETLWSQRNFVTHPTILSGDIGTVGDNSDNCYHVLVGDYCGNTTIDGFIVSDGNASDVILTTHTPSGHILPAHSGGGIFLNFASPWILNCIFKNNTALYAGGGIVAQGTSSETIYNCIFTNNQVTGSVFGGGALYNYSHPSAHATPVVAQSIFYNNTSAGAAGAIYTQYADMTINNCTIVNNTAANWGGGIYNEDSSNMIIRNTIIWGNTGRYVTHPAGSDAGITWNILEPDIRYSLLQTYSTYSSNITGNPLFVNQSLGAGADGLWLTYDDGLRLTGCSPAIDAGQSTSLTSDIIRNPRPIGAGFDMGVYEGAATASSARLYVDASVASGGSGNSWATAMNSLETALTLARINRCVSEIWVKQGNYQPSQQYSAKTGNDTTGDDRRKTFYIPSGVAVYGGFAGTESLLTERPSPLRPTVLSGDIGTMLNDADNCYHVVMFKNATSATRLDGFHIVYGNANNAALTFPGLYDAMGGGIIMINDGRLGEASTPRIVNCLIANNSAINGGAMATYSIYGSGGFVQLQNCELSKNGKRTVTQYGGAIYCDGYSSNGIEMQLRNCKFLLNYASYGGAVYTRQGGDHYIMGSDVINCVFDQNSAEYGAGFMNIANGTASITTLFYNTIFTRNKCWEAGGAIYFEARDTSSIRIENRHCTYYSNDNRYGLAGIFVVKNNTSSNQIQYINSIVRSCAITTVVAGTSATSLQTMMNSNVEGYGTSGSGWLGTGFDADGGGNIDANPLFANTSDLDGADNIWATADDGLQLQSSSPCVNSGNNIYGIADDIIGTSRPQGANVDMGAYESATVVYTITASADAGGSITPSGISSYSAGSVANYHITANAGYCISEIISDGVTFGTGPFGAFASFGYPPLTASHTLRVTFVPTVLSAVSISTASNNVCLGSLLSVTAATVNGGTRAGYNFYIDDIAQGETLSNTLNTSTLSIGSHTIYCIMTPYGVCSLNPTSRSNTITINIGNATALPAITGSATICNIGASVRLSNTVTGGVWSSSNNGIATINSTTGVVTAVANGLTNITYSYTNSFGCMSTQTRTIAVATIPAIAPITGPSSLCVGSSAMLMNATAGGVWSSILDRATINAAGNITGTSAGIATIRYTVSNAFGCSNFVSYNVAVNPAPLTPNIAYAPGTSISFIRSGANFCRNRTFTVLGSPAGGVWSATGVVTVSPGGVVNTGLTIGSGAVRYTYTNPATGCNSYREISGSVVACVPRGVSSEQSIVNSQWSLFPNPAHSVIHLKIESLVGAGSIVLTDLYGKQVKEQSLSLGINTIDVSNLAKGMYLVSVIANNQKQTQKIIVE